jgi:PKD repeat protein
MHEVIPRQRFVRSVIGAVTLLLCLVPLHAQETVLVEFGSTMSYFANSEDPGIGMTWADPAFDASGWSSGQYGVGYDADAASGAQNLLLTTVPAGTKSIYTRTTFTIDEVGEVQNLILGADYDDGYVVWINGQEVYRSQLMPGGSLTWNSLLRGEYEPSNALAPCYESYDISAAGIPELHNGENLLAIGVWNVASVSSDLLLAPQLLINRDLGLTRGPYLQLGTPDSITVRWRTSIAADSRVEYGSAPGNLTENVEDPALVTDHVVELTGLDHDTRYYYSVGTMAAVQSGDDADHYFVTAPLAGTANAIRVWIIGDSGYGTPDALAVRDAYYSHTGATHTDLWLMLGDNAMPAGIECHYQEKCFDVYHELFRKSVVWPTYGNHDAASSSSYYQEGPYYNSFTMPTAGEAGGVPSGTEAYYSFDYGNMHFISLDSYETTRAPDGPMMIWLEQDLAATAQDWVIAFWHHPPYSKGRHDSDEDIYMVEMREGAIPILDSYGVDLVFSGHNHLYERTFLIDGHYGDSSTFNESHLVDGGDGRSDGDGGYFKPTEGPGPHEGTVYTIAGSAGNADPETSDHPASFVNLNEMGSVVLDVSGNRLDSTFLDMNGQVLDYFTISKETGAFPPTARFDAEPSVGRAPLAVSFTDTSTNLPSEWEWDFDDDGTVDSEVRHPLHVYDLPGRYSVRLTATNVMGWDDELRPDCICVLSDAPDEVTNLVVQLDRHTLSWDPYPAVLSYDLLRGDLMHLRATGDLSSAQQLCLLDDGADPAAHDYEQPGPGEAFFYLVRETNCANQTGSFDSSAPSLVQSRDIALQGAAAECRCDAEDDLDIDGYCNSFDDCTDTDGDSFGNPGFAANICPTDNCPGTHNSGQSDLDSDGTGDLCDDCPLDADNDIDGDLVCGGNDNCPGTPNSGQEDGDSDALGDACDICPGDADNDIDSDSICGDSDNCPVVPNAGQSDIDSDDFGDACDSCMLDPLNDMDSDSVCGDVDNCPAAPNMNQLDQDSDDIGDECDACPLDRLNDLDGDTVCGDSDNCPVTPNTDQADDDFDETGNRCDNCPGMFNSDQADGDSDSVGDLCDNCETTANMFQMDGDTDSIGDLCDVCLYSFDPAQTDSDLDGAGDACDCEPFDPNDRQPAAIGSLGAQKPASHTVQLSWTAAPEADAYSVSRGELTSLEAANYGDCLEEGITATAFVDSDLPTAGGGFFYLVQSQNHDCGLGPLGFAYGETERVNLSAGACAGIMATDAYATGETPVYGTLLGDLAATFSSDNSVEAITEERTEGSVSKRISRLEHHWAFTVPAGGVIELHVEGYRTTSADGDDFIFEYSTDGGANWDPVPLASLPYADNHIDLIGSLPPYIAGALTLRVVDTDRTPGNGVLDRVSIDELFIRSIP